MDCIEEDRFLPDRIAVLEKINCLVRSILIRSDSIG